MIHTESFLQRRFCRRRKASCASVLSCSRFHRFLRLSKYVSKPCSTRILSVQTNRLDWRKPVTKVSRAETFQACPSVWFKAGWNRPTSATVAGILSSERNPRTALGLGITFNGIGWLDDIPVNSCRYVLICLYMQDEYLRQRRQDIYAYRCNVLLRRFVSGSCCLLRYPCPSSSKGKFSFIIRIVRVPIFAPLYRTPCAWETFSRQWETFGESRYSASESTDGSD